MEGTLKEIEDKLKKPFKQEEVEWRVQQAGAGANGQIYCMVLAYIDARAIQNRLDSVFTPFGWEDTYTPIQNDFICTLTVTIDDKKISKQNGATQTQVEGFKGGISNSFKRVCASGFGIGRYLYDLDVVFAETTVQKPSGDNWNRASYKDKKTSQFVNYWWKVPRLPREALPSVEKITIDQSEELKKLAKEKGQNLNVVFQRFNIERFGQMSNELYTQLKNEWSKL
tara:strand:- start:2432 stop:3109 length:678 start_codon:yes stop_codon:yes gene_type:complete